MHYLQIALTAKNLSYGFAITPLLNKMSEISQRFEVIYVSLNLKWANVVYIVNLRNFYCNGF